MLYCLWVTVHMCEKSTPGHYVTRKCLVTVICCVVLRVVMTRVVVCCPSLHISHTGVRRYKCLCVPTIHPSPPVQSVSVCVWPVGAIHTHTHTHILSNPWPFSSHVPAWRKKELIDQYTNDKHIECCVHFSWRTRIVKSWRTFVSKLWSTECLIVDQSRVRVTLPLTPWKRTRRGIQIKLLLLLLFSSKVENCQWK